MIKLIAWLDELSKSDIAIAGGKGANLGEMWGIGLPIPPAFVVTAQAYWKFLDDTDIKEKVFLILKNLDVDNTSLLQSSAREVQEIIKNTVMSLEIKDAILDAYHKMKIGGERYTQLNQKALQLISIGREDPYVIARSSATAEDLPKASFAGQQKTFPYVKGDENLVKAVKECWASLFTARAIFYRAKQGFPEEKVKIAVIIQKMINSEKAGVAFSQHPVTGNPNQILIEAGYGIGDAVVAGEINPDEYIVDKNTLEILSKKVKLQTWMYIRNAERKIGTIKRDIPVSIGSRQKLTDDEITSLAKYVKKIHEHYKFPQDIEWTVEGGRLYIVQTRPVTARLSQAKEEVKEIGKDAILIGLPASPGIATGKAKIVLNPFAEPDKLKQGEILVTEMTNPDFVPLMKRALAIVTNTGGITSHAAIVSRELGIPCIVGTGKATQVIKDEQIITVDARLGVVYSGEVVIKEEKPAEEIKGDERTKTKIYMNLGVPEKIDDYKDLPFDGIGLMRIEFIIASDIKEHPNHLIETNQEQKYIDGLANGIARVAKVINPKPIVVRFSDFKTNEYKDLAGGEKYEPSEANPMIGWRGASRYVSNEFEEAFKLECRAIKKVREEMDLKNVWVMIPFARTTWEVEKCLSIMESEGLRRSPDFKIWLMAEVPSVVFIAEEFSKLCDGFSIGSNDLTQLILGADRDSEILGKMGYFDERNPAVKKAIEMLIKKAHESGVTISICGQAPSVYPEFAEFLVQLGIDSMSVNPDVVAKTRKIVSDAEEKLEAR